MGDGEVKGVDEGLGGWAGGVGLVWGEFANVGCSEQLAVVNVGSSIKRGTVDLLTMRFLAIRRSWVEMLRWMDVDSLPGYANLVLGDIGCF